MRKILFTIIFAIVAILGSAQLPVPSTCFPPLTSLTCTFSKPVVAQQVIGKLTYCDVDANQFVLWTIENSQNIWRVLQNGDIIVVDPLAINNSTYLTYPSITVKVTDNGMTPLSSKILVSFVVTTPAPIAVNIPPIILPQTFSVPENSPVGTIVCKVIASDPNIGQSLTYSIDSNATGNAFTIDPITGNLIVSNASMFNYELQRSLLVGVQVFDNGTPKMSSHAIMVVKIADVNEAPIIYKR